MRCLLCNYSHEAHSLLGGFDVSLCPHHAALCFSHFDPDREDHHEARRLINWMGSDEPEIYAQLGREGLFGVLHRIQQLGFQEIAAKVAFRYLDVVIWFDEHPVSKRRSLYIRTPWNPKSVVAWRKIRGRRWNASLKANIVPMDAKAKVAEILEQYYMGHSGFGPKGLFEIQPGWRDRCNEPGQKEANEP